jgi:preprotein translocase subunit Sss1
LGFYPAKASRENRVVRIGKRVSDYAADIRREKQVAYVKARLSNNPSWARKVLREVRDWNRTAKGTEFYIPNFRVNAERALREAKKPTAERYLKSAPIGSRPNIEWLMKLYGLD